MGPVGTSEVMVGDVGEGSSVSVQEKFGQCDPEMQTPGPSSAVDIGEVGDGSLRPVDPPDSPGTGDVGVKAMELRIRKTLKKDSFSVVEGMRRCPVEKSTMRIPLCRMIHMPMVRPTLRSDVTKLMAAFQFGYRGGSAAMYVSTTDENGDDRMVSAKDRREWGEQWVAVNEKFESFLRADRDLIDLSGRMFYVYDGNHRLLAWREYIESEHSGDGLWYAKHGSPDCVVLDTSGGRGDILNAMHDINK